VDGLLLAKQNRRRLLLANFTPEARRARLPQVHQVVEANLLDLTNAAEAMRDPEAFRFAPGRAAAAGQSGLEVALPPFGVLRLDWAV
jgi:hypothetical protein